MLENTCSGPKSEMVVLVEDEDRREGNCQHHGKEDKESVSNLFAVEADVGVDAVAALFTTVHLCVPSLRLVVLLSIK